MIIDPLNQACLDALCKIPVASHLGIVPTMRKSNGIGFTPRFPIKKPRTK